ncbi:cell volume regulation protein A [Micromonospora phaseoli]|uniref:Cell volume regulation protein A n=1 Tax=Micromonospora phaseoli TaxID=1144548 RepID=A0A1H7ACV1_9ACTN|nr:potassium/proton antiporter [Micromonospora phaseoli]PZV96451.1 potassium/proton antiporter (CPA1 family) [Micromonospora phaseoli]GIJ76139.1 K+/H+ antiporter [Micromonospora phaseoli]SEJ63449.1 cell volume regulation protein A [Micromonospora phaseoli]
MTLEQVYLLMVAAAATVLVSVAAARVATRVGVPVLLAYLGVGLLLGEDGLGLRFDDAALAQALGTAALAMILVEGGLTTRFSDIRPVLAPATVLATAGVLISVGVTALGAYLLLDVSWQLALLLGAVVSSTDAAAVFSVLRTLPLPRRLAGLVEAESGLNDAPTVILVLAFSATSLTATSPLALLAQIIYQLGAGGAVGIAIGAAGVWFLRRLTLPASGLYPIATFACGILAFAAAGLVHASGFLAAYLAALILGNAQLAHRRATVSVAEGLGWIAQIGLFVMLGLLVNPDELPAAILPALTIGFVLLLLARPLSVLITLLPFRIPLREQLLLSWAGLRGAVPIVLATIPVVAGVAGSEQLFNIVFVLVVVFTLVQAPTLPWLAKRLRLSTAGLGPDLQVESAPLDAIDADLLHLNVEPDSRMHGVHIRELRLPPPAAITLVVRDGTAFVPGPATRLRHGDQLLVVTTPHVRDRTERRLRAVARAGRLAHWRGEPGDPDRPAEPRARPVGGPVGPRPVPPIVTGEEPSSTLVGSAG